MNIYLLYREEKELEIEREGGAILAVSAAGGGGGGGLDPKKESAKM
jgi:hypothetical protein